MKRKMNYRINSFMKACSFLAVACLLSITTVYAEGDEAPDGINENGDLNGDTTNVPFDNNVGILVAAGLAYGAIKAYDAKRKGIAALSEEDTAI